MKVEIEDLRAWVDGELDPTNASEVAEQVQQDSDLQEVADHLRHSQLPYQEAFNQRQSPPVPEAVRQHLESLRGMDESNPPDQNGGSLSGENSRGDRASLRMPIALGMAGMLATMMCGYLVGTIDRSTDVSTASIETVSTQDRGFASAVANYQAFYVRETVESVRQNNLTNLQEALADQVDIPIQAPGLDEHGYRFVRAQQLAFDGKPVIQLIYLKPDGLPLAFCFMEDDGPDFALELGAHFGMQTAEWSNAGIRFLMVSDEDNEHLTQLYRDAKAKWQG